MRFQEAEAAKIRMQDMRIMDGQKQMENIQLKQHHDKLEIEEAHSKEYEEFQAKWNERMQEQMDQHQQQMAQLEQKHNEEL